MTFMSSASQFKIFLVAVQVGHSARRIGVAVVGVLVFLSACKSVNRAKLSETQDASASVNIESITGCITYWSNQTGTVVTIKGKAGETQNLHVAESRDSTRQKILLFSKFKLPASLTVRSNEIVAAHLAPGYCKDFDKSGIDENKVYTFRVGAGNVGGMATLKRIDGKFHITIPIRFGGSILFGRTAPEFAKEVSKLKTVPDSQLFKRNTFAGNKDCKNLKTTWSIHCFDGLKNRVLQHVRSIEQIYTTDFFELKIDASFIEDESKVVSDSDEEEFMFRTDADLGSVAKTRYGKDNNVNRARV
ncbi:MAG: hypothetical protein NTV34_11515, partial [Proteobacteria bacterium]|nr:hypothetical protein [Pseudomonadota bacterium]